MIAFKTGLTLGLSLIMAIGAQNIFVIKQGLKKDHAYFSAFICSLSDSLLILLSVTSLGALMTQIPALKMILLTTGVLFLIYYGTHSIYSGIKNKNENINLNHSTLNLASSTKKIFLIALSFSLLNPHAILDTVVLIGGIANQYTREYQLEFAAGTIVASFIWFFGLTTAAKHCAKYLSHNTTWRALDIVSGTIMVVIAIKLVLFLNI